MIVSKENWHLKTVLSSILQNILLIRNQTLYNTEMYQIKEYQQGMDLSIFYQMCLARGFMNNSSHKRLIDTFAQQKFFKLWILFYNNIPVGTTVAHDFDDVMGEHSYRICARTCVLSDMLPIKHIRTKDGIINHQNVCSQIFIPVMLNALPDNGKCYITSSDKDEASMKQVNGIWTKLLSKQGVLERVKDVLYRGANQTVWFLKREQFLKQLEQHTKWEYRLVA